MNIHNIIKNFQILAAIGLWAVLLFCFTTSPLYSQNKEDLEQLIRESKTRAALVQNVQKAVVHIKVEKILRDSKGQPLNNPYDLYNEEFFKRFFPGIKPPERQPGQPFRQEGMGSGTIISQEGYILTNHHVVGEADQILVKLYDGKEVRAKIVGTDPESDIAVIKALAAGMEAATNTYLSELTRQKQYTHESRMDELNKSLIKAQIKSMTGELVGNDKDEKGRTKIDIFGYKMNPADIDDAEKAEERYGDIMSWIYGLGVVGADAYNNLPIITRNAKGMGPMDTRGFEIPFASEIEKSGNRTRVHINNFAN